MAIRIQNVNNNTDYDWQDVKELGDWNTVKNTNVAWQQLCQTTDVGRQITIEVEVIENNWLLVKDTHTSWQDIKNQFPDWAGVKNI